MQKYLGHIAVFCFVFLLLGIGIGFSFEKSYANTLSNDIAVDGMEVNAYHNILECIGTLPTYQDYMNGSLYIVMDENDITNCIGEFKPNNP